MEWKSRCEQFIQQYGDRSFHYQLPTASSSCANILLFKQSPTKQAMTKNIDLQKIDTEVSSIKMICEM